MNSKNEYQKELIDSYHSLNEVEKVLNFKISSRLKQVEKEYPILIPKYYLDLIDIDNIPNDPIWKQCIPSISELGDITSSPDPLLEESQMPTPRLIHRYKDRVVMLTTSRCSMQCRFCFRKRYWKYGTSRQDISNKELDDICLYLADNQSIHEVLISGGDPLIMKTDRLKYILDRITSIPSIDIIRIASRVPVTLPSRIDKELVKTLAEYSGLWFMTHFNHPTELTLESLRACKQIINSGIPVLNQTVLLKGINDNADILEELFRKLIKVKVKPHYLFHVDPVKGVKHFATGIDCGLDIISKFRSSLSSIAVPHFAIDLPEGGGKVSLQPDYSNDNGFLSISGEKSIKYYS